MYGSWNWEAGDIRCYDAGWLWLRLFCRCLQSLIEHSILDDERYPVDFPWYRNHTTIVWSILFWGYFTRAMSARNAHLNPGWVAGRGAQITPAWSLSRNTSIKEVIAKASLVHMCPASWFAILEVDCSRMILDPFWLFQWLFLLPSQHGAQVLKDYQPSHWNWQAT